MSSDSEGYGYTDLFMYFSSSERGWETITQFTGKTGKDYSDVS